MTQNNDIGLNGNIEYQQDLGGSYSIFEINVNQKVRPQMIAFIKSQDIVK